jgi:hypothetical protein
MNYSRTSLFLIRRYYCNAKRKLGVGNQCLRLLLSLIVKRLRARSPAASVSAERIGLSDPMTSGWIHQSRLCERDRSAPFAGASGNRPIVGLISSAASDPRMPITPRSVLLPFLTCQPLKNPSCSCFHIFRTARVSTPTCHSSDKMLPGWRVVSYAVSLHGLGLAGLFIVASNERY